MSESKRFTIDSQGDTLIVSAARDVGTLAEDELREEWDELLERLDQYNTKHAIIDLTELDYFGSIMLYLMVRLWKRVSAGGGKLAICNVSKVGEEILKTANFDTLWPIVSSREEALAAVQE